MSHQQIVNEVLEQLRRCYVVPDRVPAMVQAVQTKADAGAYDLATDRLCTTLTSDLHAVCPDPHLSVVWSDLPSAPRASTSDPVLQAQRSAESRLENHGAYRVERLTGNVGYFDLRAVPAAEDAAITIDAAFILLAHTGAMLLDLRANGGGSLTGVAYVCTYFLPGKPVHLLDDDDRVAGTRRQVWTLPHVPGPRYERPVFILTSEATYSAGEAIAYVLQQQGRATLIGETTVGGANSAVELPITPHVTLRIPTRQLVSPVTMTNWEGTGVVPDVSAEPGLTYTNAYARALQAVLDQHDVYPTTHVSACAEAAGALAALCSNST